MKIASLDIVMSLMRNEGLSFSTDDFFSAEMKTYGFSKKDNSFYVEHSDTLVGSYINKELISESSMRSKILTLTAELEEWSGTYRKEMEFLLHQLKTEAFPKVNRPTVLELDKNLALAWNKSKEAFYMNGKELGEEEALDALLTYLLRESPSKQRLYGKKDIASIIYFLKKGLTEKLQYQPEMTPLRFTLQFNKETNLFEFHTENHIDLTIETTILNENEVIYIIAKFPS
jgi:hypothetical protein